MNLRLFALVIGMVAVLLFPAGVMGDQNYTLESVRFTPSEFYVGEQVELRVTLKVPESVPVVAPAEPPELDWINIHDIEVVRKGTITDIRILFSTFQPGLKTLPSLDFKGLVLEPVKVHTISVLDIDPPPFQEPSGQMLLPGTTFFLILFITLLLVVPVLVLSLGPGFKKAFLGVISLRKQKKPFERLKKTLDDLGNSERAQQGDPFYSTLIQEFRIYLHNRTGEDFLSTTSGEFEALFLRIVPDGRMAGELAALLNRGDGTRFGGRSVPTGEYAGALEAVERAAVRIEEIMENRKKEEGGAG